MLGRGLESPRFCKAPCPLPGPLTFLPMHLLTGFRRKEERKPLRYITSGMVAMNFCRGRAGTGVSGVAHQARGPAPPPPGQLTLGRLRE